MIVTVSIDDPEKAGNFMITHIPVGMLNSKNVISLFKFLAKQTNSDISERTQYEAVLEILLGEKFFLKHLTNSPPRSKLDFKKAIEESRYEGVATAAIIDHMNYLQGDPVGRSSTKKLDDPTEPLDE